MFCVVGNLSLYFCEQASVPGSELVSLGSLADTGVSLELKGSYTGLENKREQRGESAVWIWQYLKGRKAIGFLNVLRKS